MLVGFLDADIAPRDLEWALVFANAVHLQTEEAFGVRLINSLISDIFYHLPIDPGLNPRALSDDAVAIPLVALKDFVRLQALRWRQPTTVGGFTIHIASLGTIIPTRFDLHLWAIHSAVPISGLRTDLHSRVEAIIDLNLKLKFKVSIQFLRAKERIWTPLRGAPHI